MKRIVTTLMAIAAIVVFGHNAEAQQYALHYLSANSAAVVDGDTVDYTPGDVDIAMGLTQCNVYIENLTLASLSTTQEATIVEGPADMVPELCAGGNCPWSGQPYDVAPGINDGLPITIELPTTHNGIVMVKLVVGNAEGMANSVTLYIRMHLGNAGIAGAEQPEAVKAYPNPTTGTVNVGGQDYDLSGRPAGVYYIPYKGSAARVIKL